MKSPDENNTTMNQWYGTAVATAIVSGAFAIIVSGVLVFNYVQDRKKN